MLGTYRQWIRAVRPCDALSCGCQFFRGTVTLRVCLADDFVSQAPEIQTMYNVPFPVSVIRTKMREEFERNRFVNKLPVVDVLLFKSDAEYQVQGHNQSLLGRPRPRTIVLTSGNRKP